jgi:hypothetical protein
MSAVTSGPVFVTWLGGEIRKITTFLKRARAPVRVVDIPRHQSALPFFDAVIAHVVAILG